jgi:hypothetical protein
VGEGVTEPASASLLGREVDLAELDRVLTEAAMSFASSELARVGPRFRGSSRSLTARSALRSWPPKD